MELRYSKLNFILRSLVVLLLFLAGCGNSGNQAPVKPYPTSQQTGMNSNLESSLPQQFAPGYSQYPLTASRSLKIVHHSNCALVDKISSADREHFRAYKIAQEQGYKPCNVCAPDKP